MKGKIVNVDELVLGRKYWVEFVGKDWLGRYKSNPSVHTCTKFKNGLDLQGEERIGVTCVYDEDCDFSLNIYEWNEIITQFDRIKNMTIEEMGVFLDNLRDESVECLEQEDCEKCRLKWCLNCSIEHYLKSECKED